MLSKRLTYVVLGIFLILTGLLHFISGMGFLNIISAILALASGILILVTSPDISKRTGWILAAIYLILLGLSGVINFSFSGISIVMAILAIAAGVVFLIGWPGFSHHIGFFLFCVWLILVGLALLVSLGGLGVIIAIIAIASGILMILNE